MRIYCTLICVSTVFAGICIDAMQIQRNQSNFKDLAKAVYEDIWHENDCPNLKKILTRENCNKQDSNGNNLLHHLANSLLIENNKMCETLFDVGVDINKKNTEGNTPLHIAVSKNYITMIQFLLEKKVNIKVKNNKGMIPLHGARCTKVVEMLINNGADINAIDYKGNNILHLHAEAYPTSDFETLLYRQFIKFLVTEGADAYYENKQGKTPLGLAIYANIKDVLTKIKT
jgi:ankyrin repeat protein